IPLALAAPPRREDKVTAVVALQVEMRHFKRFAAYRDKASPGFRLRRADLVAAVECLNYVNAGIQKASWRQSQILLRTHAAIRSQVDHRTISGPRLRDLLVLGVGQVVRSAQDRQELIH